MVSIEGMQLKYIPWYFVAGWIYPYVGFPWFKHPFHKIKLQITTHRDNAFIFFQSIKPLHLGCNTKSLFNLKVKQIILYNCYIDTWPTYYASLGRVVKRQF